MNRILYLVLLWNIANQAWAFVQHYDYMPVILCNIRVRVLRQSFFCEEPVETVETVYFNKIAQFICYDFIWYVWYFNVQK